PIERGVRQSRMVKKLILVAAFAAVAGAQVDRPSATIGGVKVTAIRHGSVMLEAAGKVIYADPWSQGNFDGLPPADLILITDIHGDHMDQKAIAKIKKEGTQIVAPPEVAKTVTEAA